MHHAHNYQDASRARRDYDMDSVLKNLRRDSVMQTIVKQEQISAQNGKQVTKITLDSGTVGHLATDVPEQALKGLIKKLKRQQTNLQKRRVE